MELYEHVFYTFCQGNAHGVDLGVARSMHVQTLHLIPEVEARLLNQIATVTRKKYNRLCDVYQDYVTGRIDKVHCLDEFKKITKEVF